LHQRDLANYEPGGLRAPGHTPSRLIVKEIPMHALHQPLYAATPALPERAPLSAGRTYFFITAEADCNLLLRVLQSFSRVGVTPYRVHASTEQGTGEEMALELRVPGADADLAERLASLCRAVIGVRSVIMAVEHKATP
jgi:hypothetical protein